MRDVTRIMLTVLIGIVVLTGCGISSEATSGSSRLNAPSQRTLNEAEQVAQNFLDAWEKADYATMYNLISSTSQMVYNQERFAQTYEDVAAELTLNSLDVSISGSSRQGTTAIIQYGVIFNTQMLGEIVDSDRVMRLVETAEGWRVAWSTMDIFDTLAERTRLELRQTLPPRGNVYDRNGQVLAAQDGQVVLLYVIKNNISDYAGCVTALSRVLRQEIPDLEAQMSQFLPETRFLVGETDPETYQIEGQVLTRLCGVETDTWTTRRYFGELAPHIIGYVGPIQPGQLEEYQSQGYPPDALIGQEGIERSYEKYLAGKIGSKLVIVAPTGEILREIAEVPAAPGQDVYLTLDRALQAAAQQAFVEAYNLAQPTWATRSPGGAAVVMNVRTGEILAMVSYPGFDPGLFNPNSPVPDRAQAISAIENDSRAPLINRAAMGQYPAGSIFKIVSTAAGLDSGVYTPDTEVDCGAQWNGQEFGDVLPYRTNWNPEDQGYLNFSQALTYSCDPYYWQLGAALHGQDAGLLAEYARQMGLGVPTGQQDLRESIGLVPDPEYMQRVNQRAWSMADTLNLVIGQGDTQVAPLQVARMVAALANGGTLFKPLLVSRVQSPGADPSYAAQAEPTGTLDYSPVVFETIRQAMCNVTLDPQGTARFVFEEWYPYQNANGYNVVVCGKTGTAQTGGEDTPPQAWFAAFAPQNDPEIAVVVIVENSCEGSEVAAPIVRRIIEDYYGMPHSEWPPLWQTGCSTLGE